MNVWVLVPVKHTATAKQRLAAVLSPQLRRRFAFAMTSDVLSALAITPGLAGVAVITCDPEVGALAEEFGARVMYTDGDHGYNRAIEVGTRLLAASGADAVMTAPMDVPLVTPNDIRAVMNALGESPGVAIVPDRHGRGCNCTLRLPPMAMTLSFGEGSLQRHLALASGASLATRIVEAPGLAFDIDTPTDLDALMRFDRSSRARCLLVSSGCSLFCGARSEPGGM